MPSIGQAKNLVKTHKNRLTRSIKDEANTGVGFVTLLNYRNTIHIHIDALLFLPIRYWGVYYSIVNKKQDIFNAVFNVLG